MAPSPPSERAPDIRAFILLGLVLCLGAWFAYANHFIMDDAYISFRYAKHFAEGKGLVWYPGSDEFGYTNFLFTLMIGVLMKLGFAAETAAFMISVPAYLGTLLLVFSLAIRLTGTMVPAVLIGVALATNHTFSAYATSGLETSLQAFLVLAAYSQCIRWHQSACDAALSRMGVFATLALLTRLDSALLLLPAYGFCVWWLWKKDGHQTPLLRIWESPLLLPSIIPVSAVFSLLAFCAAYYGYALPNSFYAKINVGGHLLDGYLISA